MEWLTDECATGRNGGSLANSSKTLSGVLTMLGMDGTTAGWVVCPVVELGGECTVPTGVSQYLSVACWGFLRATFAVRSCQPFKFPVGVDVKAGIVRGELCAEQFANCVENGNQIRTCNSDRMKMPTRRHARQHDVVVGIESEHVVIASMGGESAGSHSTVPAL